MSSNKYSRYIRYTRHETGRKIYIDPELVVAFTEYVDPSTDQGKNIANEIQDVLSAEAGGLTSGMATAEAGSFYKDFGDFSGHCVRVFYKIFQDDAGGQSKGAGVYIHNLRRFVHNRQHVTAGLFHMKSTGADWIATPASARELNSKVLRIGSMVTSERDLVALDDLAKNMITASGESNSKADFNLYHSPLAVIEYGRNYETAEARRKIASPRELADILINTASLDDWSGKQYAQYVAYVYGDASKLLVDALQLVSGSGTKLSKFEFRLLAPYAPFSVIQQLTQACGAKAVLDTKIVSDFSMRYQMLDSASLKEENIKVYGKYKGLLDSDPAISFVELWGGLKENLSLKNTA